MGMNLNVSIIYKFYIYTEFFMTLKDKAYKKYFKFFLSTSVFFWINFQKEYVIHDKIQIWKY